MKKYLIISLLMFVFSVTITGAATTDFTANGNVVVAGITLVGGTTVDLLILNGSTAESWTVDGGLFKVTNPGTYFRVGSSDSTVKAVEAGSNAGNTISCAPNTTPGTSYVEISSGNNGQNTITPYTRVNYCNGGTAGGSVGGGGGSKKPKVPKELPQVPAMPTPVAPVLASASPNAVFNRSLDVGSTGDDVKLLQKFLNSNGFVVATAGLGSVGNETTTFGAATRAALIKFQLANNIIASVADDGVGHVGPKTRAKLNEFGSSSAAASLSNNQALIQSLTAQLQSLTSQLNALKAAGAN